MLQDMWSVFMDRKDFFLELLLEHLEISLVSILIAILLGGFVGILISEFQKTAMSTPTRKCHFSPEWNVVFWRSACGEYAALITRYLSV